MAEEVLAEELLAGLDALEVWLLVVPHDWRVLKRFNRLSKDSLFITQPEESVVPLQADPQVCVCVRDWIFVCVPVQEELFELDAQSVCADAQEEFCVQSAAAELFCAAAEDVP